ncbi:hypothetical protein GCM10017781_46000 [Deinococcus metalli]|uniref:Uncharacterized protein n=1 Tax=Deinococcus metalli TaxID=1141878 RepID=A0ABQ3K155_9DEIO|nr:hypothetical protein GCM10017781_46000 [Deinococcus metalli]
MVRSDSAGALYATNKILQGMHPAQTGVRVTGRVLTGMVHILLAETCEVVHAPAGRTGVFGGGTWPRGPARLPC